MKSSLEIPDHFDQEDAMFVVSVYGAGWQDCLAHRMAQIAETGELPAVQRIEGAFGPDKSGFMSDAAKKINDAFSKADDEADQLPFNPAPPVPLPRKLSGFDEACEVMKKGGWVDWTSGDEPSGNFAYSNDADGYVREWARGNGLSTRAALPVRYFCEVERSSNWFEVPDPTMAAAVEREG